MRFLKKPWAHDYKSKRFTSTALKFGAIPTIVPTLNRPRLTPLNQGDTLECAVFAAVMNGKYIHGEDFSIDWQKSKISRLQGKEVDIDGSDPNAAMDSQTYSKKGGYLPKDLWDAMKAEILDQEAMNNSNDAYIKPDAGKDAFDSICIELQRHYNFDTKKGACVQMFTGWYDTFMSGIVTILGKLLGYHSYLAIDFNRMDANEANHYLLIQNSYGETIGDGGFQKFYRPVVNKMLSQWGATFKIPSPLTPEQTALAKQSTPYGELQRAIINAWYALTLLLIKWYGKVAH